MDHILQNQKNMVHMMETKGSTQCLGTLMKTLTTNSDANVDPKPLINPRFMLQYAHITRGNKRSFHCGLERFVRTGRPHGAVPLGTVPFCCKTAQPKALMQPCMQNLH